MNNVNWTAVASIAACLSAFISFISIVVNILNNKKTYKANLEIKSKLSLLNSIKNLTINYIAEVEYALFIYDIVWSNKNGPAKEGTKNLTLDDYNIQMSKTKPTHDMLITELKIYGSSDSLRHSVNRLWEFLDKNNLDLIEKYANNRGKSEKEKQFFKKFEKAKDKLLNDLKIWYKIEFDK